ncbi:hypothetical protein [Candidatus Electronema sp. TJ]|uniref:hypothetical protein n=1 Tax=Candidatus Electronema sp. TJ TaxID=3401573 RepID=UPI003AA81A0E
MKKIAALALLLTCAAAAAWQLLPRPADSLYYADHLPAETVATVSLFDLKGLAKTFPASAPGKFFAKPVMRAVLAEQGAEEEAILRYEALHDSLADILSNPFFQLLFGDDAAFALLPPDPVLLKGNPAQALRDSLVAFGSSSSAGIIGGIASTLSNEFSQETVDGLELTRLRLKDGGFLYGYGKDGVLILAFNPKQIAAALAQKKAGGRLREQPFFLAAKKFWQEETAGRSLLQFSLNPKRLPPLLAALEQAETGNIAARLDSFHSLSGLIVARHDRLKLSLRAEHSLMVTRIAASEHRKVLALLTETVPLYLWTAALDRQTAETLLAWTNVRPETLRQKLGLSLDEIMTAVGPQAGLAMSGIVSAGISLLPKLTIFLQMRQAEPARLITERLRSLISRQGFAKEQTAEADGHAIYYWRFLPAEAAQPAIALTGDMLYIANGPAGLKALLTEKQAVVSHAVRDSLGSELADQLAAASVLTFAARPARLAAEARKAKDWLTAALAGTKAGASEHLREAILLLMQSVELAAAWANFDKQHLDMSLVLCHAPCREIEK